MEKESIVYFQEGGPQNTEKTLEVALKTARKEKIKNIVVASGGSTLLKIAEKINKSSLKDINLVGVTLQAGTWQEYGKPDWNKIKEAEKLGAESLTCTHALMGNIESSIKDKFGGIPPGELIAYTFYSFSQGTKVCVEITMSAVDAGLIPAPKKVIAIAGSDRGADTALTLTSASSVDFFDLEIHKILCKPL